MATGQEFPQDYEPATLEHPARNVPKPVFPEAAKQETEAGAQAFLDYHSDASWYAYQTGDTSYAREIIAPECQACQEELDLVEEVYGNGDWSYGTSVRKKIHPGSFAKNNMGYYSLPVVSSNTGTKLISDNRVVREFMAYEDRDEFNANIDFKEGRWMYITASPRSQS